MKYVNSSVQKAVTLLAVAMLMLGCGTSSRVKDGTLAGVAPKLVPTEVYLPIDQFDKEGVKLPYEVSINPYAEQSGRIKKESVTRYIEARRAYKSKEYAVAAEKLHALTREDEKLSGPWVMLGDIATKQGEKDDATELYQKAIEVNAQNINAYIRLAKVLRIQGQFIQAQNLYAEALALWPDFPEAHLNLAILYDIYMNMPKAAQQHMETYQFLTGNKDEQVATWLVDLRSRTGLEYSIRAGQLITMPALSIAGDVK